MLLWRFLRMCPMQIMFRPCLISIVVLLISGCAATPLLIPPPNNAESAGIGISLKIRYGGFAVQRADAVYFIKECSDSNEKCFEHLISSNYAKDGRIYLLNAEPGSYMVVAAATWSGIWGDPNVGITYLPNSLIQSSKIQVHQGQIGYIGSYVVDSYHGICSSTAESVQLKYAELIEPDTIKCGLLIQLIRKLVVENRFGNFAGNLFDSGKAHYRGSAYEKLEKPNYSEFLDSTQRDLSEAGWVIKRDHFTDEQLQ